MDDEMINSYNKINSNKTAQEIIEWSLEKYGNKIAFASSFGAEDVVLIDMIYKISPDAEVFTLDTGRLPKETYELMQEIKVKYPELKLKTYFPDNEKVEEMVNEKGFFSFRESLGNRSECCRIRKIEPLKRALKNYEGWITGLRKEQSITRTDMQVFEFDRNFSGILKINPLLSWTEEETWNYIKKNDVPYNKLHDQNYPSIGCEPCTRAVKEGEDIRAGRWWWENAEDKECGLHKNILKDK